MFESTPTDTIPEAGTAPGGYTIELHVAGDNSMTVSVEREGAGVPESVDFGAMGATPEAPEAPAGTPVKGLKGAIDAIIGIVQRGGEMDDTQGDADFAAGFEEPGGLRKFG